MCFGVLLESNRFAGWVAVLVVLVGEGGASFGSREVRREVPGLVIAECLRIGAGAGVTCVISSSVSASCTVVPLWTFVG